MKPCKLWWGSKTASGYGRVFVDGRYVRVHRREYQRVHGPIPNHVLVRHICDNPACWEIEHLVAGTPQDNMNDKVERNRQGKGEDYCNSKLTENAVRHIKARTDTVKSLAALYGVSLSLINRVRQGRNWKHVS